MMGGGGGAKIGTHIAFDEHLNLEPFVSKNLRAKKQLQQEKERGGGGSGGGDGGAFSYRLCGALVHAGSTMQFGHYYCFVR